MNKIGNLQSKIWGLDSKINSLEEIRQLLNLNYYESIDYLSKDNGLSDEDKTLRHHWIDISPNRNYRTASGDTIEYFTATGFIETTLPKTKAFADDECQFLLPRERRVSDYRCHVIYLNFHNRYYCIIYGSNSAFKAKSILMGNGFKNHRKPEWGKVDDKPAQFNLSNDIFYWEFNKYSQQEIIDTPNGQIEIRDIKGIDRGSERNRCNTSGTGPNYMNEITSKSSLGCNYSISESDFELATSKVNIITGINQYSDCTIDPSRTIFFLPNNGFEPIHGREADLLLHIYSEVIPGLLVAYNRDRSSGNWTANESAAAQRRWALDVIKELCQFHEISLDEIAATLSPE